MKDWTRRGLMRASAGAAIAVPIAALSHSAGAATPTGLESGSPAGLDEATSEPVMFCIHNAKRGEVSILQGTNEVVVRDRLLVARILRASGASRVL
jgi:hypothetical protein